MSLMGKNEQGSIVYATTDLNNAQPTKVAKL